MEEGELEFLSESKLVVALSQVRWLLTQLMMVMAKRKTLITPLNRTTISIALPSPSSLQS